MMGRARYGYGVWVAILVIAGLFHGLPLQAQSPSLDAVEKGVIAKGVLLYDPQAQKVVFARDPDGRYAPASTTKLMTSLLVMERNGFGGSVTIQERDTWVEPSHVPLIAGETVTVKDLVSALLIGSDNDCAMALGRKVGGDLPTFISMMNQRARTLGCRNTNFVNPNGLPAAGQFTTANDLLLIFQKVIANPELRRICETRFYDLRTEAGAQKIKNHNKLLGVYPGMGPAKTGWTNSSQHTYAASCTRNGRELQLIILKSTNKWADAKLLFDYGFSHLNPVQRQRQSDTVLGTETSSGNSVPVANSGSPSLIGPVPQSQEDEEPAPAALVPPLPPRPLPAPVVQTMPESPARPASQDPVVATTEVIAYVVQRGDTLSSISRRFSSTVQRIQRFNPDVDPLRLVPGTVLHIPKLSNGDA